MKDNIPVNNTCIKLTIKAFEDVHGRCPSVFTVDFEQVYTY